MVELRKKVENPNSTRVYNWYDGWNEDLCKVTDDGKFESMTSGDVFESKFFDYWAYTDDLIPWRLYEELCPTPNIEDKEKK